MKFFIKKWPWLLLIMVLLIIGFYFLLKSRTINKCSSNSQCINTCCGCLNKSEKCNIKCEALSKRECSCSQGSCYDVNSLLEKAGLPNDLYSCTSDSDCVLTYADIIRNDHCGSEAINNKYKDLYIQQVNERLENGTMHKLDCSVSFPMKVICVERKCLAVRDNNY